MESFKVTAPSRADLAGGTLDIWPLFCMLGGARTINLSLDLCATAQFEVHPEPQFSLELSVAGQAPMTIHEPLALAEAKKLPALYRFPAAVLSRYLMQKQDLPARRIRVAVDTAVPPQSGLGGSSTLCVAMVRGMARVFGDFVEQGWQYQLLNWVRDMEAAYLNMLTGNQDYLAALFGGINCFVSDIGHLDRIPYSDAVFNGFAERTLILYSGEMHDSGISNWEVVKGAIERNADIMQGMDTINQLADGLDAELTSGNLSWKHIGTYLNEEWNARKSLFRVNTPRLDEMITFLRSRPILGAKVCGAAAGGSLLVLVDPEKRASLARDCAANGIQVLKAGLTRQGVTIT